MSQQASNPATKKERSRLRRVPWIQLQEQLEARLSDARKLERLAMIGCLIFREPERTVVRGQIRSAHVAAESAVARALRMIRRGMSTKVLDERSRMEVVYEAEPLGVFEALVQHYAKAYETLPPPTSAAPEAGHPIRMTRLEWRLLPPGRSPKMQGAGLSNPTSAGHAGGRIEFIHSLGPLNWYEGSHLGETVYVVAEFPNVAIADTQDYGNALYYCLRSQGDWKRIFQLDKQEARRAGATRIFHAGGWEERVRRLVGK